MTVQNRVPAKRNVILTERDVALLCDLFGFGLLLRDQIHALHFPECELRRVNRRLKLLADTGFIAGDLLPLGPLTNPTAASIPGTRSQRVYRLGAAGAGIVAHRLGVDLSSVRQRAREGTRSHAAHALEVANARIALERAAACSGSENSPGAEVAAFYGEAVVRHAFEVRERQAPGAPWRLQIFKPDGLARCRHGNATHFLFFEIDLSFVATAEFVRKLRIHGTYLQQGLFSRRYGADASQARTLVLTTGERRVEHLTRLAEAEGATFAWFSTLATFSRLAESERGLFLPVWSVPLMPEPQSLFDPARSNETRERGKVS